MSDRRTPELRGWTFSVRKLRGESGKRSVTTIVSKIKVQLILRTQTRRDPLPLMSRCQYRPLWFTVLFDPTKVGVDGGSRIFVFLVLLPENRPLARLPYSNGRVKSSGPPDSWSLVSFVFRLLPCRPSLRVAQVVRSGISSWSLVGQTSDETRSRLSMGRVEGRSDILESI